MQTSSLLRSALFAGLSLGPVSALAQPPDPSVRGSFATTNAEYNLGDTAFTPPGFPAAVEVRGVVFHPTNLAAGPFPLVLFLHGRHGTCFSGSTTALEWPCTAGRQPILSFRGYDYAADHLASHGYVVISISANGINARDNGTSDFGALARAQLIQHHLDLWRTYNTTGGTPFGTQFVGRVDLTRVGTMGHSRGGEGVMRHYLYNQTQPTPYPVKVIVPIAPTDFGRWQVNDGAFVAQLLPYCDGDVSDLQGVHFFDDARYSLTTAGYRQYTTVMGANHNFFNTNWTPGSPFPSSDDWTAFVSGGSGDPHCGTGTGNGRLSAAQQRDVGLAYLTAYFRNQVGGESGLLPWIDGTGGKPPAVSALALHVAFQPDNTRRRDLNRLQVQGELTTNNVGGTVSQSGLTPHDLCGGASPQPQSCLTGQSSARDPHRSPSTAVAGLSRLRTGWGATSALFTNDIPAGANRDVSTFQYFQFRSTVNFTDTRNAAGQPQDFSVRFTDGAGATQTLRVGQYSNALYYPPGTVGPVPKVLTNGVRLPLSALTAVNKANLARVEVLFNQQPSGAVFVADAHFYRTGSVAPTPDFSIACSPSTVSAAPGGSASTTCTVASTGGFSSPVTLSCAGAPAGVTCSASPNPVTPPANGSVSATLTLAVGSGVAPANYTFGARGTSGATFREAAITLTVTGGGGAQTAVFDSLLRAPKCGTVGISCDSGPSLLLGRAGLGPEPNQPNTINNSCADGTSGLFHSDESNDRIKVSTVGGGNFAAGQQVRIDATVWAWTSPATDKLDLYYAANANAPAWTFITTLTPTVVGAQTLSATYTLPAGTLQAVRAQFRYQGAAGTCSAGGYNDRDDLVFAVQ